MKRCNVPSWNVAMFHDGALQCSMMEHYNVPWWSITMLHDGALQCSMMEHYNAPWWSITMFHDGALQCSNHVRFFYFLFVDFQLNIACAGNLACKPSRNLTLTWRTGGAGSHRCRHLYMLKLTLYIAYFTWANRIVRSLSSRVLTFYNLLALLCIRLSNPSSRVWPPCVDLILGNLPAMNDDCFENNALVPSWVNCCFYENHTVLLYPYTCIDIRTWKTFHSLSIWECRAYTSGHIFLRTLPK